MSVIIYDVFENQEKLQKFDVDNEGQSLLLSVAYIFFHLPFDMRYTTRHHGFVIICFVKHRFFMSRTLGHLVVVTRAE